MHDVNAFAYGALTHYGDPFQKSSANTTPHIPESGSPQTITPHNTQTATPASYHTTQV